MQVCKLQVKQLNHVIPIHNLHKPNCTPKNPLNMWVTGAWALSRCQSHFGTASCQLVGLATHQLYNGTMILAHQKNSSHWGIIGQLVFTIFKQNMVIL